MRLTPSWVRSSRDASSGNRSAPDDSASPAPEVPIYYATDESTDSSSTPPVSAASFVPESDMALLEEIAELEAPVTVDELADHLIWPADPPIETWADVHELLYDERLPGLEAGGALEFDAEKGMIEHVRETEDHAEDVWFSRPVLGLLSLVLLATTLFLVSTGVVTATPF